MSLESIAIREDDCKAINFISDFNKYAREHGIRNPFEVSRQEDYKEPTYAEKEAWVKMRYEYIARRCFYEIGYDMFLVHTAPKDYEYDYDISYMRDSIEFIPCKSADHQCTFDCPKFAECALQGTWKPE